MSGHWVDPRFRPKRRPASRPASGGSSSGVCPPSTSSAGGVCPPCPPCPRPGAAGGASRPARTRTLTPQERVLQERMERLRRAAEQGALEGERERAAAAARAAGRRPPAAGRSGLPTTSRPTRNTAIGELNATLAAQAATSGQTTTTRLTPAGGAIPKAPKKKAMTFQERQLQERIARIKAAEQAGYAEAAREAAAKEAREKARAMARAAKRPGTAPCAPCAPCPATPGPSTSRAPPAATPRAPQPVAATGPRSILQVPGRPRTKKKLKWASQLERVLVIQPGEIDPTETTVITVESSPVPPQQIRLPRSTPKFEIYRDEDCEPCAEATRMDTTFLDATGLDSGPEEAAGGVCERIPQTTACPTTVRSITARPLSTNPNVSMLTGLDDEDLMSVQIGDPSEEDLRVPTATVCPRVASPQQPSLELGSKSLEDIYASIQRRKDQCREEIYKRDREFLKQSKVLRQDNPDRVFNRILQNYYRVADPSLAANFQEDYGDVPVDELIDLSGGVTCPAEEYIPPSRELFEAMREPEFGAYGRDLLNSNLQINPPQQYQAGPFESELLECVDLMPTSGYSPGPLASELQAHVRWEPPRQPDVCTENLLMDPTIYPPPLPPSDPCGDLGDLIDWL